MLPGKTLAPGMKNTTPTSLSPNLTHPRLGEIMTRLENKAHLIKLHILLKQPPIFITYVLMLAWGVLLTRSTSCRLMRVDLISMNMALRNVGTYYYF